MTDSPQQRLPFPKQIFAIMVTECMERFGHWLITGTVFPYLIRRMKYTVDTAFKINFALLGFVYTFPLLGAVLADCFIGKFKTIICFTSIFIVGASIVSINAIEALESPHPSLIFAIGIFFVTMGSGTIKPCVMALAGDQFVLPQQENQLLFFYYAIYFLVNVITSIEIQLLPKLATFYCYGGHKCYSGRFGIGLTLVAFTLVIYLVLKRFFIVVPPEPHVVVQSVRCISHAVSQKCTSTEKVPHWLDRAEGKFGTTLVRDVKQNLRLILIFLPLMWFYVLDEYLDDWTRQAEQMYGYINNHRHIQPQDMVLTNTIMIIVLTPLYFFFLLPLLAKLNLMTTPLQRITGGCLLTVDAFLIAGFLSLYIEANALPALHEGRGQIRLYNPLDCDVKINALPYLKDVEVGSMGYKLVEGRRIVGKEVVEYNLTGCEGLLPNGTSPGNLTFKEKTALGYILTTKGLIRFTEDVRRHPRGATKFRTLVGNPGNETMTYEALKDADISFKSHDYSSFNVASGAYTLSGSDEIEFYTGGVYRVLVFLKNGKIKKLKVYEITEHNTLHMFWQIPQYLFHTMGELLIAPICLQFAYTEAPASMKTTIVAMFFLIAPPGKGIYVFVLVAHFKKQSHECFFLGVMMAVFTLVFAYFAKRYKYVHKDYYEVRDDAEG